MTIMVIDDSVEQLSLLSTILKDDYTVKAVNSGKKALEYLQKDTNIDLILLDILMPEMDGFEVCKLLNSNPITSNIPVIFLTALENESDIVSGFDLGAVDYIVKPFEPKVLKARVKTHLRLKEFQDNLQHIIKEKDRLIIQQSKLATLGEMFDNIVHQWKQPLSVISISSGTLEHLKKVDMLNDEKFYELTKYIDDSIDHLVSTIDTFRDFAKNKSYKEKFNLTEVVDVTLDLLRSKIKNNSITIENNVDGVSVFSYKNETIQILMNLLANSVDELAKNDDNRIIKINSNATDDEVSLSIEDNGRGVPVELHDKIFEKHFTTKKDEGGSGLGLYMSKQLAIEKLEGDLTLESTQNGAKFILSIKNKENAC